MMGTTSMVHVRVDDKIKSEATETLASMGLSVSDAVRVFLTRVVVEKQLPFALKVPSPEPHAAMMEADAIASRHKARFATADELFNDLEKPASSKRARLPRVVDYTKSFLKDWQRLSHSGRYDMNRLKVAMLLLITNDAPSGPEWLDHPLGGDWDGYRECHIGGDFLLTYKLGGSNKAEQVIFIRTGSYADLFE